MSFTSTIMKKTPAEQAAEAPALEKKIESVKAASSSVSQEFSDLVADLEDLVKATTSLTAEELAKAKKVLNERIAEARQTIDEVSKDVGAQAQKTAEAADQYVRAKPWQVIGATAVAGVLLGYLLGRRE